MHGIDQMTAIGLFYPSPPQTQNLYVIISIENSVGITTLDSIKFDKNPIGLDKLVASFPSWLVF